MTRSSASSFTQLRRQHFRRGCGQQYTSAFVDHLNLRLLPHQVPIHQPLPDHRRDDTPSGYGHGQPSLAFEGVGDTATVMAVPLPAAVTSGVQ